MYNFGLFKDENANKEKVCFWHFIQKLASLLLGGLLSYYHFVALVPSLSILQSQSLPFMNYLAREGKFWWEQSEYRDNPTLGPYRLRLLSSSCEYFCKVPMLQVHARTPQIMLLRAKTNTALICKLDIVKVRDLDSLGPILVVLFIVVGDI